MAYAGTFFDLIGGRISHIAHGSGVNRLFRTGFVAVYAVASWALRPASHTVGAPMFRGYGVARCAETPQVPAVVCGDCDTDGVSALRRGADLFRIAMSRVTLP